MKIKTLTMSRKRTENYQSRGAAVTIEVEPGDTYQDAVDAGKVLLAVALGDTPDLDAVARANALLDRVRMGEVVTASVTAPSAQPPKRRGRPSRNAQQIPAGQ